MPMSANALRCRGIHVADERWEIMREIQRSSRFVFRRG